MDTIGIGFRELLTERDGLYQRKLALGDNTIVRGGRRIDDDGQDTGVTTVPIHAFCISGASPIIGGTLIDIHAGRRDAYIVYAGPQYRVTTASVIGEAFIDISAYLAVPLIARVTVARSATDLISAGRRSRTASVIGRTLVHIGTKSANRRGAGAIQSLVAGSAGSTDITPLVPAPANANRI